MDFLRSTKLRYFVDQRAIFVCVREYEKKLQTLKLVFH